MTLYFSVASEASTSEENEILNVLVLFETLLSISVKNCNMFIFHLNFLKHSFQDMFQTLVFHSIIKYIFI